jgi:long-chain fatty acid transport protein
MRTKALAIAIGIACAAAVPVAQATNGYMSHAYSPHAKGMAGAGEAAFPQDSLSIIGNPAGLTRVGKRLDLGATWFSPHRKYSGTNLTDQTGINIAPIGSTPFGGTVDSGHTNFFIPNFGFSYPIDSVSSVGIAVFGNGGMNTQYPSKDTYMGLGTYGGNSPNNIFGLGGGNAGVNLEQLGISLAYARDLTNNFSLGGSVLIGYQKFRAKGVGAFAGFTETFTQSLIASLGMMPIPPTSLTDNGNDSSWGYGFQIGALWDINPMWSVGASYRTKIWMQDLSKYSDLFADNGSFDIPAVATIGAAFKPNNKLTFALDAQWIGYGDIDAIANENKLAQLCDVGAVFGQPMFGGTYNPSYCLGGSNGAGFGWDDMWIVKFGVQYELNNQWTVRAGYSHGDQPIDGSQVAFNALAPAVIQDHWTVGASWKLRPNYELTFWGMYAPQETVKGPGAFTTTSPASISMYQYELGVNFAWLF